MSSFCDTRIFTDMIKKPRRDLRKDLLSYKASKAEFDRMIECLESKRRKVRELANAVNLLEFSMRKGARVGMALGSTMSLYIIALDEMSEQQRKVYSMYTHLNRMKELLYV